MTINEFKVLHPADTVYIQIDDTERLMTDDEYEAWVIESVNDYNYLNP
jgi:hypothetical protein